MYEYIHIDVYTMVMGFPTLLMSVWSHSEQPGNQGVVASSEPTSKYGPYYSPLNQRIWK